MRDGGHFLRLVAQLRQIATKAASEQSSPNREKMPRKLVEVTKRTSAGIAVALLHLTPMDVSDIEYHCASSGTQRQGIGPYVP